ncbi:tail fiber protein [Mucilaginibacter jinjuensis]|uniref:Tail fiber protein n=1 Tax=Mucilaginibacter jinjuensis TaxID=1176721 RepID=A0ABY7TCH3_9SPHI|nr:tail fiber protein [Mucilaginibacter jinjuensis]WCT13686.1 tail fiber protein [Mucilaginibacter jinjuensis]
MNTRLVYVILLCFFMSAKTFAQYSGSFIVQGDANKYYPVIFTDANWYSNKTTDFEIGRSSVHEDATGRGSLIAKFRTHTNDWGNGSMLIDGDVREYNNSFIADWTDGSSSNVSFAIIIWFKGGSNSYYFNSSANINPVVYDGVQNALPFQELNGPIRTYLTSINPHVNTNGFTGSGSAFYDGVSNNHFAGYVGIGTTQPDKELTVKGTIHASEVLIDQNVPQPDYVFDKDYDLAPLKKVSTYIDQNHHLPEIPSAAQVAKEGINLAEMDVKLLKK